MKSCTNLAPFGQQTPPTYNNLQKVADGEIIKKANKYDIVLFGLTLSRAKSGFESRYRCQSLAKTC